jgi:hypothetical protein
MANNNSTEAIILKTLFRLAKDVDLIKKMVINGMAKKVDVLWEWKEQYPAQCPFLFWLKENPRMVTKVKQIAKMAIKNRTKRQKK